MSSPIIFPLIALLLQAGPLNGQNSIVKTILEGFGAQNVDFLCDIPDRQEHPLYWKINDYIYDLYHVPEIFEIQEHRGISIDVVDRRMNGWVLQCFTINPNLEDPFNPGLVTTLIVHPDMTEGPPDEDLLQPAFRGIPLHYRESQVGPDNATLSWLYTPNPTCEVAMYNVEIYAQSDINDAMSADALIPIEVKSTEDVVESILIPSSTINSINYFRISASNFSSGICVKSDYFYNLMLSGIINEDIYMNGNSARFLFPETLYRTDSSLLELQLIWPKDENTQCVCPPIQQILSICACNMNSTNNLVTITGSDSEHEVVVSNLAQEVDHITLYFVYSVCNGVPDNCNINLRSLEGVYNIIQAPSISVESGEFCFFINSYASSSFEVKLRDSTGSLTPLSATYSNPECLSIGPSLYPDECGPFQLSVAAIGSTGRSNFKNKMIFPEKVMNLCHCYQAKENFDVIIINTNSTSAELTLECNPSEYRRDNFSITLRITTKNTETSNITAFCDSVMVILSLTPSTNYSVDTTSGNDGAGGPCSIKNFMTEDNPNNGASTLAQSTAVVFSFVGYYLINAISSYYGSGF